GLRVLLLLVGLAGVHGLLGPLIDERHVGLPGGIITAFQIGLAAVGQLKIAHGIVIVGTYFNGLVQILNAFVDEIGVLLDQRLAGLLRHLNIAFSIVIQPNRLQLTHRIAVG